MCPTLTVCSFFRRVRSTFLFICSTTSNLNNFEPQQLEPQKRVQNEKKKQNRRPEPRNHTEDPPIAPLFFGTMRLFSELFGLHQRVPPSFVSTFCNTMDFKKSQRVAPFTFFGTGTLFKNLILKIFLRFFFNSPNGSPSIFIIFCNQLEFHKARRVPPFTILSLIYSAYFGRSRLVVIIRCLFLVGVFEENPDFYSG